MTNNKRPEAPFHHHGRVVTELTDITEARARRHGQVVTQDDTGDRPYNALDAEYMGQEDYRDGKLAASQEVFERRARGIAGLRHLGIATDMSTLYLAYQCGYEGHCG